MNALKSVLARQRSLWQPPRGRVLDAPGAGPATACSCWRQKAPDDSSRFRSSEAEFTSALLRA